MKRIIIDRDLVRVSKPGKSAESADLDDYLVHESFDIDVAVGGVHYVTSLPATIPHNLGYRPIVFIGGTSQQTTIPDPCSVYAWADEANVYVNSDRGYDANGSPAFVSVRQPTEPIPIVILGEPQP